MASTESSDFAFDPKVWQDHFMAYFDDKLVYGAFAVRDNTLVAEGTGLTVNFPYYNKIGGAEKIGENVALTVDNMSDDSFFATVFEVGKAVGIKKKAFKNLLTQLVELSARHNVKWHVFTQSKSMLNY